MFKVWQCHLSNPVCQMAFKFNLLASMEDPELKVFADDEIVVIKDKYPKAELHLLVLPKENLKDLKALGKSQGELLRKMELKGKEMARDLGAGRNVKLGYHARPSMQRLHLHVISDDFRSPCLKTLKHWNSFTTDFFVPSSRVIRDLESLGRVKLPSYAECSLLLKSELRCHKCAFKPKNMPNLKSHLGTHT